MDIMIGYCGLDCRKCEAYLATVNDDDEARRDIARRWSEYNHVDITPDMINCLGCRTDGVKTPYCSHFCEIRRCALEKGHETCGCCPGMESCGRVAMVFRNSDEARDNLRSGSD